MSKPLVASDVFATIKVSKAGDS